MSNTNKTFAEPVNAIQVIEHGTLPDGVQIAIVPCADYEAKADLPKAIRFGDHLLGCSGWDSDRCVAFYRSDRLVAVPA